MHNPQRGIFFARPVEDLEQAARVASGDSLGASAADVLELALQKFACHFRLDKIVNAGAAAAPHAFVQLDQIQIWNGFQNLSRLRFDLLAVTQMTRLMVSDRLLRLIA